MFLLKVADAFAKLSSEVVPTMTKEGFVSSRSGTIVRVVAVALTLTSGTGQISPEWLVANQRGV